MKARIRVISRNGIISEFTITGDVTFEADGASPEQAMQAISGHAFQVEYAVNEHVPNLRMHFELSDEL